MNIFKITLTILVVLVIIISEVSAALKNEKGDEFSKTANALVVKIDTRINSNNQVAADLLNEGFNVSILGKNIVIINELDETTHKSLQHALGDKNGILSVYKNKRISLEARGYFKPKGENVKNESYTKRLAASTNLAVNDYDYPSQWGLNNIGQRVGNYSGVAGIDIGAELAWQTSTGLDDGVVAIFGHKIDINHEDLSESIWTNRLEIPGNNIDDDANGYIDDVYGVNVMHGNGDVIANTISETTALAGIISAKKNNSVGIAGITSQDKILTCNLLEEDFTSTIVEIAACFSYVIDQKSNKAQNIHSVIIPWGFSAFYEEDYLWLKDLVESLIPYDIFVVAPTKMSSSFRNLDFKPEYPASFDSPNIISVTAIENRHNILSNANIGYRTVHTAAPGDSIITTTPGQLPQFTESNAIFFESFEDNDLQQWQQVDDAYTVVDDYVMSGSKSLQITGYGNGVPITDRLISKEIDLSSYQGKLLAYSYGAYSNPENGDFQGVSPVLVNLTFNNQTTQSIGFVTDTLAPNWRRYSWMFSLPSNVSNEDLKKVRVLLKPMNVEYWSEKLYLDDFAIGEVADSSISNRYDYFYGTSAAAAYVAGAISIVKDARPELSMLDIKNLLISSGTKSPKVPYYSGFLHTAATMGERSIKVMDESDSSILTCEDQKVLRRISPKWSGYSTVINELISISVLNINCASPSGNTSIYYDGKSLMLEDNGANEDNIKGDGIYSGEYSFSRTGDYTVNLDSADPIGTKYRVYSRYQEPTVIPFEWEESDNVEKQINPQPPFPINIGNIRDAFNNAEHNVRFSAGLGTINVSRYIAFGSDEMDDISEEGTSKSAKRIEEKLTSGASIQRFPVRNKGVIIAPHYGANSVPSFSDESGIFPFIVGEKPNRKWVIEYRGWVEQNCLENPLQTYQVVFNEAIGDITFNYKTVGKGCDGDSPSAGIQIGEKSWVEYDDQLENNTSLKFKVANSNIAYINQRPRVIQIFPILEVAQSERVVIELDEHIIDDDMSYLNYSVEPVGQGVLAEGIYVEGKQLIIQTDEISDERVNIVMTDKQGLRVDTRLFVIIKAAGPSIIREIGTLNILPGTIYEFNLDEYFEDNIDSILDYSVLDLDSDHFVLEENILKLSFSNEGNYEFTVRAMDSDHIGKSMNVTAEVRVNASSSVEENSNGGGSMSLFVIFIVYIFRRKSHKVNINKT